MNHFPSITQGFKVLYSRFHSFMKLDFFKFEVWPLLTYSLRKLQILSLCKNIKDPKLKRTWLIVKREILEKAWEWQMIQDRSISSSIDEEIIKNKKNLWREAVDIIKKYWYEIYSKGLIIKISVTVKIKLLIIYKLLY